MTFFLILFFIFFLIAVFYTWVFLRHRRQIFTIENISPKNSVLVLGAGLEKNGNPSDILLDRLITARDLISLTAPDLVILSGAESPTSGNEPHAMEDFLVDHHVDKDIIRIDEQGKSTFHSLINLSNNSSAQETIIISQRFHLSRALMISSILGLECVGLAANNMTFAKWKIAYWYIREILATPFNICKIIYHDLNRPIQKS